MLVLMINMMCMLQNSRISSSGFTATIFAIEDWCMSRKTAKTKILTFHRKKLQMALYYFQLWSLELLGFTVGELLSDSLVPSIT